MSRFDATKNVQCETENVRPMPTPGQCRSARAFLGWSADDLAAASGVGRTTVFRYEKGQIRPFADTLNGFRIAFENEGLAFLFDNGKYWVGFPDPVEE